MASQFSDCKITMAQIKISKRVKYRIEILWLSAEFFCEQIRAKNHLFLQTVS